MVDKVDDDCCKLFCRNRRILCISYMQDIVREFLAGLEFIGLSFSQQFALGVVADHPGGDSLRPHDLGDQAVLRS